MKRYKRYFNEARRNPDQNPFVGAWDYLIEYKDDPDVYISFTTIDKIGINPLSKYNTPIGIYCYPLKEFINQRLYKHKHNSEEAIKIRASHSIGFFAAFAGGSKYVNFIKKKSSANFIDDMYKDYGSNDFDKDMKILRKKYEHSFPNLSMKETTNLLNVLIKYFDSQLMPNEPIDIDVNDILTIIKKNTQNLSYVNIKRMAQNLEMGIYSVFIKKIKDKNFRDKWLREFLPTLVDSMFDSIVEEGINTVKEKNPIMSMWNITRLLANRLTSSDKAAATKWNFILRQDLGYDGFGDKSGKGYIHPSEPMQAVFLNPKAFTLLHRVENKPAKKSHNVGE